MDLDHVPGGARRVRDDGRVAPGQQVEQARLSRVGRTDDDEVDPVAQAFPAPVVAEMAGDLGLELPDRPPRRLIDARGQVFVGKVDGGLDVGQGAEKALAPGFVEPPQLPLQLAQGLAPLGLGLGVDQIGEALGRGQVELPVLEGAAGEFAGLGRPQPRAPAQGVEHRRHHDGAAVQVQLRHVLAGIAGRPRKPQHQTLVQCLPVGGVADTHEGGPPGRRRIGPAKPAQGIAGSRSGNADDGDPGAADAAGPGEDGVGFHVRPETVFPPILVAFIS